MAASTTTSHDNTSQLMPPSPPPSPPSSTKSRAHKKKKPDPFDELPITPIPSPVPSPPLEAENPDTLLEKIVFTPVLVTSFILSLFLVDYRARARRREAHTYRSSLLYWLSPSSWLDPEPYQDPTDSTWSRDNSASHVEPHDAISPNGAIDEKKQRKGRKKGSWHLNKKIRRVTRMEVTDAFEMRKRVIVGMLAMLVLGSMAVWSGAKWIATVLLPSVLRNVSRH